MAIAKHIASGLTMKTGCLMRRHFSEQMDRRFPPRMKPLYLMAWTTIQLQTVN